MTFQNRNTFILYSKLKYLYMIIFTQRNLRKSAVNQLIILFKTALCGTSRRECRRWRSRDTPGTWWACRWPRTRTFSYRERATPPQSCGISGRECASRRSEVTSPTSTLFLLVSLVMQCGLQLFLYWFYF